MLKRAIGALRLDEQAYADIAANPAATREALLIVLIHVATVTLAFQFGATPGATSPLPFTPTPDSSLGQSLYSVLFWPLEVGAIYFVVIRLLGGNVTYSALFRLVVFAGLPLILGAAAFSAVQAIFTPTGAIGIPISLAVGLFGLWSILATVKAVRIAAGVSTGRALVAAALGNTVVTGALGYALALAGLASVS